MPKQLKSGTQQSARIFTLLGLLTIASIVLGGCATEVTKREFSPIGTFQGSTANNRRIQITIESSGDGLIGVGTFADEPLSLSVTQTYHGRGVLHMLGSNEGTGVSLSYDGAELSIIGLEDPVYLYRKNADTRSQTGPISGTFSGKNPSGLIVRIHLAQLSNLITGTGNVYGDTVAVSGVVDDNGLISGRAFYVDGSEAVFNAEMSDSNTRIKLIGFGDPIELRR